MLEQDDMKKSIMLIDDEEQVLLSYETALDMNGFENLCLCQDSREALSLLEKNNPDMVLLDLTMPFLPGEELLPLLIEKRPDIPVVIITGVDSSEMTRRCLKAGAYDYLVKPVDEKRLVTTVRNTLNMKRMECENELLRESLLHVSSKDSELAESCGIITRNSTMLSMIAYVSAVSKTANCVLITGETGTGKELFARAVHKASGSKGELVTVNVAGLDDAMFSDTLFGHGRGAFTGADKVRPGLIEQACDGTLFLDEIGDLSIQSQVKLLRLLQDGEYFPLGADEPKKSNAKIVTATNRSVEELMEDERFRNDLFYRLRTHHIHLPSLRERLDDIPLLLDHFLGKAASEMEKTKPFAPKELNTLFENYSFPGNIRELEGIVYDAMANHRSRTLSLDIFKKRVKSGCSVEKRESADDREHGSDIDNGVFGETLPPLKDVQKMLIDEALTRTNGNKSLAAELLGTSRQALNWHLRKEK